MNVTKVEKREKDGEETVKCTYFSNGQSAAKLGREGSETILFRSRRKLRSSGLHDMDEDIVQRRKIYENIWNHLLRL